MQSWSSELEGFAREHVQFCGNDTEPDFWSVLPRLEGSLYGVNIRAYADPWRVFGYDVLAHYFYSDEAKEDYSEGYTPANFSDDIYGNKYRKLHAYFQVSHMQHCHAHRKEHLTTWYSDTLPGIV